MKKSLTLLMVLFFCAICQAYAQQIVTPVQHAENLYSIAVKRLHRTTQAMIYPSSKGGYGVSKWNDMTGNAYKNLFLSSDIEADKASNVEEIKPLFYAARAYISGMKRIHTGIANAYDVAIASEKKGEKIFETIWDTTALKKLVQLCATEAKLFREYVIADSVFRAGNPKLYDLVFKEEVAFFLRLTPVARKDYSFRVVTGLPVSLWRGFMRSMETRYLASDGKIVLQSSGPDKKTDVPSDVLKLNMKSATAQALEALNEAGFTKEGKLWKRSSTSPNVVTAIEAEVIASDSHFLVKFIYTN